MRQSFERRGEKRGRGRRVEFVEEMRSFSSGTCFLGILLLLLLVVACPVPSAKSETGGNEGTGGRSLVGIEEMQGNATFQCLSSGPCLRCQYSEKNDEKYSCSETGYRMPFKCLEIQDGAKEGSSQKIQRRHLDEEKDNLFHLKPINPGAYSSPLIRLKWRSLLGDSSKSESSQQSYVTYKSCVPVEPEERLSILGFELIMVSLLLICGPIAYFRQKRSVAAAGAGSVRIPNNSIRL